MPSSSSWCSSSAALLLGAALGLAPAPAFAATVLEKTVTVDITPPSSAVERTRLRVRLETEGDLEAWSDHVIYVDEHRQLANVEAYAVHAEGRRVKVRRQHRDTAQVSGGGTFHDSGSFEVLSFTGLELGVELHIDQEIHLTPYYPAYDVDLLGDDPIERLEVRIGGGGDAFRYRLEGPGEALELTATPGGVVLQGRDLPALDPPAFAPVVRSGLLYAWGDSADWRGVGSWWRRLLDELPREGESLRTTARRLAEGVDDPRRRLEALFAFLRKDVRYVAVEVGIGGFKPSAPSDVLERRWGDCKDKSLLLVDLLAGLDIEAHPALILAGHDRRIDPEFPTPWQFNHAIVAVKASDLGEPADDPVAGGWLFLDPTQTYGAARWLQPHVQDQDALVVTGDGAELVRTPLRPQLETRELVAELVVSPQGHAVGGVALVLRGLRATGFLAQAASAPPERTEEDALSIFTSLLPGATVERVGWEAIDGEVPTVNMMGQARIAHLVEGLDGASPSLRLQGIGSTPDLRHFDERRDDFVVQAGTATMRWHLRLPEGFCRPREKERTVENEVGRFVDRTVRDAKGNGFVVERQMEIARRWVGAEQLAALRELALAEHRAGRRRVRLTCDDEGETQVAPSP